ncbi:hypothetical protein ACWCV2_01570 [Streptomyces pseudogriseolus]|uniref:hypothetical protein n=1 Tax=Streptomyces TaxID=1883 RepID=UPI00347E1FD9
MSTGWALSAQLAASVAAIPGQRLAVATEQLVTCVYSLRERNGTFTTRRLPPWSSAIYVALDEHRRCLYTGIVQRGTTKYPDPRAIKDRTAEHYRNNEPIETRATWHHLWVIPLHHGVPRPQLEAWETRVRQQTASPQTRRSRLRPVA